MRPGLFRIDEIRRQRRNSAPVVDAAIEQIGIVRIGEIRRRLNVHLRHQEARHGQRAQHLPAVRFWPACHRRPTLGAEVLHDHFLNVPVSLMQVANRDQRIHALFRRLANSNQNSGGKRNLPPPRIFNYTQALRGFFVGSVVVGGVFREQPRAGRFQHKPDARSHAGQPFQPFRAHQSGIGMRQQARFAKHLLAHRFQIMKRGFISEAPQRIAHLGKKQLRLVSQAEQRLGTSHALSGAHYFHHLVGRHGVRAGFAGIAAEGAVAAVVAAKIRQGKKYLAGISDDSRPESRAGELCRREQRRQHGIVCSQQMASCFTRDRLRAGVRQLGSRCGQRICGKGGHTFLLRDSFHPNRLRAASGVGNDHTAARGVFAVHDERQPQRSQGYTEKSHRGFPYVRL